MTRVSATQLRNNLSEYLDRAAVGETVVIERNSQEVARLVPTRQLNWRDKMKIKPKFLVPPKDLIEPVVDTEGKYG